MKIGMIFPGYSSQYVGMAKELYDESRLVQEYFEEASHCLDMNFVKLCFASSDIELARATHAYTATFLVSSAIQAVLKEEGITADVVAGYNLGEYAALYAAGAFTFPDGLYLLNKFATFYQTLLDEGEYSALRIAGLSGKKLDKLCLEASTADERVFVAVYNSPEESIVAGSSEAVERMRDIVAQKFPEVDMEGVAVEIGLHSELLKPIVDQITPYLEKVDFKDLVVPQLSGIDAALVTEGTVVKQHVLQVLTRPIVWSKVLDALAAYDLIVEVGPGSMLRNMVKKVYPDKIVFSVNTPEDIKVLKNIVQPEEQKDVQEEERQSED